MSFQEDHNRWLDISSSYTDEQVIHTYENPKNHQLVFKNIVSKYLNKNDKIIEVGCEFGVTSFLLGNEYQRTLLDINKDALIKAERGFAFFNQKATFLCADMFAIPAQDEFFDVVFNAGVIEHFAFADRVRLLQEYARILKPNGMMIIAYPNHNSLIYRWGYLLANLLGVWKFLKEFNLNNMTQDVQQANLECVAVKTCAKEDLINASVWSFWFLNLLDKIVGIEGYLKVVIIKKKSIR